MANELHTIKLGSDEFPIYSKGVLLNSVSSGCYPLALAEGLGSTTGNNKKIYTDSDNYLKYNVGDLTVPTGYSTSSGTLSTSSYQTNSYTPSSSTGYFVISPTAYAVYDWATGGTLNPGESWTLPATTFSFSIHYTNSSSYGPVQFTLNNCYAIVAFVDNSNNVLASKYVNLAGTYVSSSYSSSSIKAYATFNVEKTIPALTYTHTGNSATTFKIRIKPFCNSTSISDYAYFNAPANKMYTRAISSSYYIYNDSLTTYRSIYIKWTFTTGGTNYKIRRLTRPNLTTSSTGTMSFATNGLWFGTNSTQALIDNYGTIRMYGVNSDIQLSDKGLFVINSTNAIGDNANFKFGTPSSNCDWVWCSSSNSNIDAAIRPATTNWGLLGRDTYSWYKIYGNNIYKSGTAVSTSDDRYKDFKEDIDIDFAKLKYLPKKKFSWKEGRFYDGGNIHFGTSAQKMRDVYPELVHVYNSDSKDCKLTIYDEESILAVDYEKLSMVALAAIDKLHDKITVLEDKIIFLENKLTSNYNE